MGLLLVGYGWLLVVMGGYPWLDSQETKAVFLGWLWVVMGVSVLVMSGCWLVVSVYGWLSVLTVGNGVFLGGYGMVLGGSGLVMSGSGLVMGGFGVVMSCYGVV